MTEVSDARAVLDFPFAALQATGCATFDESPLPVVDDGALTSCVRTAIANEAGPGAAMNVNVAASAGTVQLTGFVESEQSALRAEQIARSVEGVKMVKNDLNVTTRTR